MLPSTPTDSEDSRDGRDRGKDPNAMSSRDQLRFMQLWGERRQMWPTSKQSGSLPQNPESPPLLPQSMSLNNIMSRRPSAPEIAIVTQPSQAGLTYVPRSAWEGLPDRATQPLGVLEDQPVDEDVLEAPMMAQLARSDQLSEESIASVQSFCGAGSPDSLEGGSDNTGAPKADRDQQHILREPGEVAAMLRNITCGRRYNYADNAFALRLEKDVWAELNAELERQNRLDARLEDVPSEDAPSPSSSPAAPDMGTGSASDRITVSSMSAAQQSSQQSLQELQQQQQQQARQQTAKSQIRRGGGVGRALADGLGSLKSRLKAGLPRSRSARSSDDSGEPGAGERRGGKKRLDASVTGVVAGWASTYTETDSTYSDEDTSSSASDRQSNRRCRWRKSRVIRVSQGSSSNHNAGKAPLLPDAFSAEANDATRRPAAYCVTDGSKATSSGKPSQQVPGAAGKTSDKFAFERLDQSQESRDARHLEPPKPHKLIHPMSHQIEDGPGVEKSAHTRLPSALFMLTRQSAGPPVESHLRQSNRFFAVKSSLPVDEEARRIVAARRSVSATPPTTADVAAAAAAVAATPAGASAAAPMEPGGGRVSRKIDVRGNDAATTEGGGGGADRQFLSGRHGRLSAASVKGLGGRQAASHLLQSAMLKDDELDAKFKKQPSNKNGSNRATGSRLVSRLPSVERLREAEMVAGHHTEPHFTSDGGGCESRRSLVVTGAGEADNCSSETRKRNLVRRRCRHVVLIQPQVVHWDLQLSQIMANPKARRHRSRKDLPSGSASPCSASSEPAHSRQSLPTVTSAALKSDFNRLKVDSNVKRPAGDSPGHIVHWSRLGQVPSERRWSARVKRVGGQRWRDRRIAKAAFLQRAHCPEVVDNPSLTASDDVGGDLPEGGRVSTATIATVSTCDLATSSCSISSSCCGSSSTFDITEEATTADSRLRPRCRSSSVGSSKATPRSVSCYALPNRHRRISLGDDRAPAAGDHRVDDRIAGRFGRQPRRRIQAAPLEPESAAATEELACLPAQLGCLNCSSAAVAQWAESTDCRWLLAKRSRQPKSGYSHSVHYLPSVTVIKARAPKLPAASGAAASAAAAGTAAPATRSTLLIACELTVGRTRRRLTTAAAAAVTATSQVQDGLRISEPSSV